MKKEEFKTYFNRIGTKQTNNALESESLDAISDLRNKASIACARVGQELALIKNAIGIEFLRITASEDKISNQKASILAEVNINNLHEVSRRELQYLREALYNFCNTCASRLNVLQGERKQ